MSRELMMKAFHHDVSLRRPKSKEDALKYLVDNGEKKLADVVASNGWSDQEIIDAVYDVMVADAEEGNPPDDEEFQPLTHEEVFGSPAPEPGNDADDWEQIFGVPMPEKKKPDPSEQDEIDSMPPPEESDEDPTWESIFGDDKFFYADGFDWSSIHKKSPPMGTGRGYKPKPGPQPKPPKEATLAERSHPHTKDFWNKVVEDDLGNSTWEHSLTGNQVVFRNGISPIGQWGSWIRTRTQRAGSQKYHIYHEPYSGRYKALTDRQHKWLEEQHDKLSALSGISRANPLGMHADGHAWVNSLDHQDAVNKRIERYEDNFPSIPGESDWEYQDRRKASLASQRVAHHRTRAEELADADPTDVHSMRILDFLNGLHADVYHGKQDITHVLELAKHLGVPNPPQDTRALLKAIGGHIRQQSEHVPLVAHYHKRANDLASKAANSDHWHDVFSLFREIPDAHAHRVAKRLGVEVGDTPRRTRLNIAGHVWGKSAQHPLANLPQAAASTGKPTVSHIPTPVDSQAVTRMK